MTNVVRFNPTSEFRRIQSDMDRLFDTFFPTRTESEGSSDATIWTPRVDLAETEEAYLIHVDVPGVSKDAININYHDGVLSISGERTNEAREEGANFMRVERFAGRFYRSFSLPKAISTDAIEATYADGVLNVTVPKAEESKPRRIQVQ